MSQVVNMENVLILVILLTQSNMQIILSGVKLQNRMHRIDGAEPEFRLSILNNEERVHLMQLGSEIGYYHIDDLKILARMILNLNN